MEASGRVVVVTGGGSGIGAALCRAFADAGAKLVVVADVNETAAATVAAEVGGIAAATDVTQEADVRELVQRTLVDQRRLDIYCSNAGIAVAGGEETPDEVWRRSWDVHVMAHVYAARALIPAMLERGEGHIVGTVSAAALLNHVSAAPYAASKAAGLSFMEWLAITYGSRGIGVSALCPQGVRTPMLTPWPATMTASPRARWSRRLSRALWSRPCATSGSSSSRTLRSGSTSCARHRTTIAGLPACNGCGSAWSEAEESAGAFRRPHAGVTRWR